MKKPIKPYILSGAPPDVRGRPARRQWAHPSRRGPLLQPTTLRVVHRGVRGRFDVCCRHISGVYAFTMVSVKYEGQEANAGARLTQARTCTGACARRSLCSWSHIAQQCVGCKARAAHDIWSCPSLRAARHDRDPPRLLPSAKSYPPAGVLRAQTRATNTTSYTLGYQSRIFKGKP